MNEKVSAIKKWLGTGSINIFGKPFSGKDTQGYRLSKLLDAPLIGGGEILRDSVIPEAVKKIMSRGELIPTQDYINIVLPYLSQESLKNKPLILSSVGRWIGEERGVVKALESSNHPLKVVIYLEINERDVNERFRMARSIGDRGNRDDDAQDKLRVRLKEFEEKTTPVIDYYFNNNLLIKIDGRPAEDKILEDTIQSLYDFMK